MFSINEKSAVDGDGEEVNNQAIESRSRTRVSVEIHRAK